MITNQTELRPLAKKLKVSYGALLEMNPELQRGVPPPGKHALPVPDALVTKPEELSDAQNNNH